MYIGEGYKRSRNTVSVANSDPAVVKLATYWIRRFAKNPVRFAFQYHEDQDPEQLIEYWGGEVDADREAFYYLRKSNSGKLKGRAWRSKHGVLTVQTCDTDFRARLQAWIDCVVQGWLDSLADGA